MESGRGASFFPDYQNTSVSSKILKHKNNSEKNDPELSTLDSLVKQYVGGCVLEEIDLTLKKQIESKMQKIFSEKISSGLTENSIKLLEKITKLIFNANENLLKLNKNGCILRPVLENLAFDNHGNPLYLSLTFNHWVIKKCRFNMFLTGASWEDAELTDLIFEEGSIYDLSGLAKASFFKIITFKNPNGHCERDDTGNERELEDGVQNDVLTAYHKDYLTGKALFEEKKHNLEEQNKLLKKKVVQLEKYIKLQIDNKSLKIKNSQLQEEVKNETQAHRKYP